MRPPKTDFRFLIYTPKKHIFYEKMYIFQCLFTRQLPKFISVKIISFHLYTKQEFYYLCNHITINSRYNGRIFLI